MNPAFGLTSDEGFQAGFPTLQAPLNKSVGSPISLAGLIAHYKMETLTLDSSGNNNTLTNVNSVTQATGLIGQAASFDAMDDQELDAATFTNDFTGDFTIAMWVNLSDRAYLSGFLGNEGLFAYYNYPNPSDLTLYVNAGFANVSRNLTLNASTWYFLVFQNDHTNNLIKVSVNNDTFTTASHHNTTTCSTLTVGGDANPPNHNTAGLIDEVSVWSRLLTGAELTKLYNGGAGRTF